jgi:apolipoprotein N-acyltransferase
MLLLAGVVQAISIAWPWNIGWGMDRGQASGPLQLLSMALAIHVVTQSTTAKQAALKTWVFATTWLAGSFWWLYVSMHQYGGLPSWAATMAVLALACALSLYYAAAGAVYWRWRGQHSLWSAAVFAAAWTLAELARGQWLTGFPWGAIGYAHVDLDRKSVV